MEEISFEAIRQRFEKIRLPECDLVVGISEGGVVPATLVAYIIGCDVRMVGIRFRGQDNTICHSQPVLLNTISVPAGVQRILLVDDVSVSGKTIETAKNVLKDYQVITLVLRGNADYVLFPEIEHCVKWPWRI